MTPTLTMLLFGLALPLGLVLANWLLPFRSRLGFALRTLAIAALLLAMALRLMWLFPPWWTPYAALGLLIITSAFRLRRSGAGGRHAVELALSGLGLAVAIWLLLPALTERAMPPTDIDLAAPLPAGRYLVVNGGPSTVTNAHVMTLTPGFESYRGQSHAVDIIGLTPLGFYADGIAPPDPAAYAIFGLPVLAPCAGTVTSSLDGMPDMTVPEMDRTLLEGNHVLIRCDGGDVHVLLAHLQQGSVQVAVGESVEVGQRIGKAGNSGNSSTPHLHIHAQRGSPTEAPISGEPLHFTIEGDYPYRNDRLVLR